MKEIFYQGLITALRSQAIKALLVMIFLVLGASMLAAGFSGRQPLTVAIDVGISGLRIVLLLIALFWVQELFVRDFDNKTLYFILAYPITRSQYLTARFITIAFILMLSLLIVGGLLWATVFYLDTGYQQETPPALDIRFLILLIGIWLDLILITAFMIFISTICTTSFLPMLLGLGFALAARSLGSTFDLLRHSSNTDPQQASILLPILDIAQFILPDLSRLDWRFWILYNQPVQYIDVLTATTMSVAYVFFILLLASQFFNRRNLV